MDFRRLALLGSMVPAALAFAGVDAWAASPARAGVPLGNGDVLGAAIGDAAAVALPDADPPQQVRIEQRFSIRISPGGPMMPPDVILDMRADDDHGRLVERSMGKCVAMSNIVAVQGGEGNRLILFMRDQKIVSAALEKTCEPRDFYSGFYVTRNIDGMLCVDRDTLQSRSGANCRVKRLKAVVEAGRRR